MGSTVRYRRRGKRLQADNDLPETGYVDDATSAALDDTVAELGLQMVEPPSYATPHRCRPC